MNSKQQAFFVNKNLQILESRQIDIPETTAKQLLIRHTALGINYSDYEYVHQILTTNVEDFIPGMEAVGIIEKVGKDVQGFQEGQRVAYGAVLGGGFAEYRNIHHKFVIPVDDAITDEAIVANLTKGITAHYLLRRTFFVKKGMFILVHAGTSGVGQSLIRLGKHYNANIISTCSQERDIEKLISLGCYAAFSYNDPDWINKIQKALPEGVSCVYDNLGGKITRSSFECMMKFGLLVNFGNIMGKVESLDIELLNKGSFFITKPRLFDYEEDELEICLSASEVMSLINNNIFPNVADHKFSFVELPNIIDNISKGKLSGSKVILMK